MMDLVMWTYEGERTLPRVLKQIDRVIPKENVNNKMIVDDHSTDNTVKIAKDFNWQIHDNPSTGISSGANEALRHVTTPHFISFEQDLYLAKDWWDKTPIHLQNPKVAVASGMRFANQPRGLTKLQRYVAKKYRGEKYLSSWLRDRRMASFTLGKTIDNTIYKTKVIKALGGFPVLKGNTGIDSVLAYRIMEAGFEWVVDYNVQSVHLRQGLKQELQHQRWYASAIPEIHRKIKRETGRNPPITEPGILFRLFISPGTGLFVAVKTREPSIFYIHPLIRLFYALGLLGSGAF